MQTTANSIEIFKVNVQKEQKLFEISPKKKINGILPPELPHVSPHCGRHRESGHPD